MTGWGRLLRSLGESLAALLRAELDQLEGELGRSWTAARGAVVLLAGAAVVGFWTVGLVCATLVVVLAVWLPAWAATLIVLAVFLTVAALLAWRALVRWQRFESPVRTVRRRIDEHLGWWESQLDAIALAEAAAAAPRTTAPARSLEVELGIEEEHDERAV